MKLAWYTPYSSQSAIGLFSREVVASLLQLGHQVTIVRSESLNSEWSRTSRECICEVITAESIDKKVREYLRDFDAVIFNIGNHLTNHYYCLGHQTLVPGITLLHDYILHNLLIEWLNEQGSQTYVDVLRSEAGDEAVRHYQAASDDLSRKWFMSRAAEFPVLRFAMAQTHGVVAHADFYASLCEARLHCPVTTIPLAFGFATEAELTPPRPGNRLNLVTIGDVNVNKRCESVIQAISSSQELSSTWQYRIVGNFSKSYGELLMKLARTGEHPVDLVLLGKVDDATLHRELRDSHAIACLRQPTIEGASASVIVSLVSARPTLVSDSGCYAEIPDDIIYRVRRYSELGDIAMHLNAIRGNFDQACAKGLSARSWATQRHSGMQYAKSLLPFIERVLDVGPSLELADTISSHLSAWHCGPDLAFIDRIQLESTKIFGDMVL